MAKVIENKKGFKVIEISRRELVEKLSIYGALGICDFCNGTNNKGYYIAVLNHWYCPECYESWLKRAKYYTSDSAVENRNFEQYKQIFGINENGDRNENRLPE